MREVKKDAVLIVDDDRMDIMALTQILSPEYTVYAVKEGKDAVDTAEEFLPDVILLDVIMPEMDGYEVFAAMKASKITQNIPVIFITGLSEADDEEKGLRLGAADYIVKPFRPAVVRLRVQNQIKIISQTRLIIEKETAEKSSRNQVEFLTRMSHEMLTPMNAIMGMAQIAKRSRNSGEITRCLDDINTASRKLLELINDLLELSDMKEGKTKLVNAVFSFNAMFREISKEIDSKIADKHMVFTSDIDPSVPMLLVGDKERLAQVINNLLTNAIKFTPEQGKIHFFAGSLYEENGKAAIKIEVTDTGIGIPKEKQSKIFNAFDQVDSGLTGNHDGVGLGLAISKHIVELMDGEIGVESEPGKGSKFSFTFKMQV